MGSEMCIRDRAYGGKTYLYAVNDSPWPVDVQVEISSSANCRFVPLRSAGEVTDQSSVALAARVDGVGMQFQLQPFELMAGTLTDSQAAPTKVTTNAPSYVSDQLQQMLTDIGTRLSSIKSPIGFNALQNPGFDLGTDGDTAAASLPSWEWNENAKVSVNRDDNVQFAGTSSLRIESSGPVTWVRSETMRVPKTGRLSLQAMVRTEVAPGSQPPRLALEGVLNGKPYYRFAELKPPARTADLPEQREWSPFMLHIDDLPPGLSGLRVRFDLMGAGRVWVDDIRLFDLALTDVEQVQLARIIGLANYQLREGRVADCERTLRGYWPQYLYTLVPAPVTTAGVRANEPRIATAPKKEQPDPPPRAETGGMLNRVKGLLRF